MSHVSTGGQAILLPVCGAVFCSLCTLYYGTVVLQSNPFQVVFLGLMQHHAAAMCMRLEIAPSHIRLRNTSATLLHVAAIHTGSTCNQR